jgi:hypothetical protein
MAEKVLSKRKKKNINNMGGGFAYDKKHSKNS